MGRSTDGDHAGGLAARTLLEEMKPSHFARFLRGLLVPLILSVAIPLHAEPLTPEPNADDYARARALYKKAAEAFEASQYTEARRLLLDAWAVRHSYDVAASLGDTEIKLGLFAEAAEHLSFSVRNFPPLENEQALANVRKQLEIARREVASFVVRVNEPGAEIRADQRLIGTSPLSGPVFLPPGRHTVEARKGAAVVSETVAGEASKETPVALHLGVTELPPPPPDEAAPRSIVPLIVGGAVFAVGLTAGIAFKLAANADEADASELRDRLGPGGCVGEAGASHDCAALRSEVDSADTMNALSTAGFVVAGVAVVATPVSWLLWPRPENSTAPRISGVITPGLAVITASGRF
jgi:tetratricopeptide (TPR) repeat protein